MTAEQVPIRPLLYARLRLFLGGQAEYVGHVLDEEIEKLYVELEQARAGRAGHATEREVEAIKEEIVHLVNVRRDITTGLLDERMEFLKVRVYRGGQADTLLAVFQDRQADLFEALAKLRSSGMAEDDHEISETRARLVWLTNVLRELGLASIELVGPDADPRP